MIKFLLTFTLGLYSGVYISQNYEIPPVDDPRRILEKIKKVLDENRKEKD